MNTLSNSYFKKMCSARKISNPDFFIDQKISELRDIADSIGFEKENLFIYKSSDLWKRLISYAEENIFQEFYSILAQMKVQDFVANNKVSHLVQIPMDLFFCNYFHKLYPEDTSREMDLAFLGQDKESLYISTREFMIHEGLIENKKPVFIIIKSFPYLIYNYNLPEWDMSLKDIKNILANFPLTKKEIFVLLSHIANVINIKVKDKEKGKELDYNEFYSEYKESPQKELIEVLAENLLIYLKEHRKRFLEKSGRIEEAILNLVKKRDVKNIGQVLKSDIAFEILLLADGSKNTTQISKELNKSVATISTYANRLKKMNLIRILPDGKVKRNVRGFKINLELGL
jgi:hypothetical protein